MNRQTTSEHAGKLRSDGYEKISDNPDFMMNYHFAEYSLGCPAHWHEHIELLHVCRGEIIVYIQGNRFTAAEGNIIVINSGQIHTIPQKSPESRYECLIPHTRLCRFLGIIPEEICLPNLIHDSRYHSMYRDVMQELREKKTFYKTSAQIHLLELLTALLQEYGSENHAVSKEPSSRKKLAQEIISFISKNYAEPISTADICKAVGFDESYACHHFKGITGSTILEHLNMVRCEHARALLLSGEKSIADCAEQCGFRHLPYFTRTYKRYMDELPSETARREKDS